jgi:hypothetical protein
VRSLAEILALLPVLREALIKQQYKSEVGHLQIGDAASALDEAHGYLTVAVSAIEHEEEMMEAAE